MKKKTARQSKKARAKQQTPVEKEHCPRCNKPLSNADSVQRHLDAQSCFFVCCGCGIDFISSKDKKRHESSCAAAHLHNRKSSPQVMEHCSNEDGHECHDAATHTAVSSIPTYKDVERDGESQKGADVLDNDRAEYKVSVCKMGPEGLVIEPVTEKTDYIRNVERMLNAQAKAEETAAVSAAAAETTESIKGAQDSPNGESNRFVNPEPSVQESKNGKNYDKRKAFEFAARPARTDMFGYEDERLLIDQLSPYGSEIDIPFVFFFLKNGIDAIGQRNTCRKLETKNRDIRKLFKQWNQCREKAASMPTASEEEKQKLSDRYDEIEKQLADLRLKEKCYFDEHKDSKGRFNGIADRSYIDRLAESWANYDIPKLMRVDVGELMNYLCSVGNARNPLEADLDLIIRMHCPPGLPVEDYPVKIHDFKRMKLKFKRPDNTWVIDNGGHLLAKIFGHNLCKTLLFTSLVFSQIILRQNELEKEIMLDHYNPFSVQDHIHLLRDKKYQLRLVQRLALHITNLTGDSIIPPQRTPSLYTVLTQGYMPNMADTSKMPNMPSLPGITGLPGAPYMYGIPSVIPGLMPMQMLAPFYGVPERVPISGYAAANNQNASPPSSGILDAPSGNLSDTLSDETNACAKGENTPQSSADCFQDGQLSNS
jgi:hypothetical protein